MITIAVLFIRMTQLQQVVLRAMEIVTLQSKNSGADQSFGLETGIIAPEFILTDMNGNDVALTDFEGEPVLLVFSSTQCAACKTLYPHLQSFRQSHADIHVVMISHGSDEEQQQMVTRNNLDFPVLQWDEEVIENYEVPGTPFLYLIDGNGIIVSKDFANTLQDIEQLTIRY
jgi:methylamine dehydrogenase accessory protein MauD